MKVLSTATFTFPLPYNPIFRACATKFGEVFIFNIPVLYYTQLLGLAMGFNPEVLGIHMNAIDFKKLFH
jgi:heterodisulfide reductase subunit B